MEFDPVMSVDATAGNEPIRQQSVLTLICYKCRQNGYYRNDCPNWTGIKPVPDQNLEKQPPDNHDPDGLVTASLCCASM